MREARVPFHMRERVKSAVSNRGRDGPTHINNPSDLGHSRLLAAPRHEQWINSTLPFSPFRLAFTCTLVLTCGCHRHRQRSQPTESRALVRCRRASRGEARRIWCGRWEPGPGFVLLRERADSLLAARAAAARRGSERSSRRLSRFRVL